MTGAKKLATRAVPRLCAANKPRRIATGRALADVAFHLFSPSYDAAARGDIKTVRFGRLKRVPTAWLRQKLGLDEPGTAA
jgi:hypothetical protein